MASASLEQTLVCKPSTCTSNISRPNIGNKMEFCLSPALKDVVRTVGAEGDLFTIKEVLQFLRMYICNKLLFDVHDPRKITCENDLLEKAFGVKTFVISEVMGLLSTNMFLVTSVDKGEGSSVLKDYPTLSSIISWTSRKRGLNEGEDFTQSKRHCAEFVPTTKVPPSPMFIEIAESPVYDSSPETVFSVQGDETTVVKDSSDDLWFLETEDEYEVEIEAEEFVEYEVESLASSPNEDFSDTESEVAEVVGTALLLCQNDSDVEFWADSSDNDDFGSDTDSDPEITDGDKWKCQHCAAFNRPFLRFCQKCWQLRTDWLPARRRPKRHHRRLKRTKSAPNGKTEESLMGARLRKTSQSLPDFSISLLQECKDVCEKQEPSTSAEVSSNFTDSQETVSLVSLPGTSQEGLSECGSSTSSPSMCSICLVKPKNASIIHGRTGHQVCCYGCGKKLWERNKPCPVCRRTIQKVIQNFIV